MPRHPKHADPKLPPAGHARNEELRRRRDDLDEHAEALNAEAGTVDPKAFEIDREIAYLHQKTDGYEVRDPQPGYVYVWRRDEKPGEQVRRSLNERVQMADGNWANLWEVVQSDMPESRDVIDVRGYRKIGDVILLRAKADRYRQYQIQEAERRHRAERGPTAEMEDLAARSKGLVNVYSESEMTAEKTTLDRAARQGFARNEFNKRLREGTAHRV